MGRTGQAGFQTTGQQSAEHDAPVQAAALKVYLLGGFRVEVEGQPVEAQAFRLHKARTLIKLLALEAGQRLHREQVLEALWPDAAPAAALNNLHQVLHVTRRVLSGEKHTCPFLQFEEEMLSLGGETHAWVDVAAFERLTRQAHWTGTQAAYELALEQYGGELLPEDLYEDWAEGHRLRLRGDYVGLLFKLGQLHEAHKNHSQAAAVYQRLVQVDPLNEAGVVGWMRSLTEQGLRGQAIQAYQELAQALRQELGVEPAQSTRRSYDQIVQAGLKEPPKVDLWSMPKLRRHNLPRRLSSFVGRVQELAQVKALLAQHRLVTLVGAGGVGKSRLGLEAAWEVVENYPDGIWLAELATVADGNLLPQSLEAALGVQFAPGQPLEQALENYLQDKHLLLVLDNCEHILEACAGLVERLLDKCPTLVVLTTSRARLGLQGEQTWVVPPLSMPDSERLPELEALRAYDALRLFAERAASARPGFTVTAENGAQVAQVCQKMDGIPLAIELAAARAGMLGIEQIAERLGKGLDLLRQSRTAALPRHQTMRLCLDWSHRMLSSGEQALLRRLAVFAGGFTLAAAESVCGFGEITAYAVLDLLEGLVNRSLVVVEGQPGEEMRFRLLEPVRQYSAEKLAEAAETETLQDRHLGYCLELAIEGEQYLRGREQAVWLKRLMGEMHNFRAALSWASERDVYSDRNIYSGLHLALALGRVWFLNNMLIEGSRWVRLLVAREEALAEQKERSPDQQWLHLSGLFVISQSRLAIEMLSEKLEEQVSPKVYNSLSLDWVYWKNVQFYEDSVELLRIQNAGEVYINAMLDHFRSLAPGLGIQGKRILAVQLNTLIIGPLGVGFTRLEEVEQRYAQARRLFDLALEISQQIGTTFDLSEAWGTAIGMLDTGHNRFEQAVYDYQQALRLKELAGDLEGIAYIKDRLSAALAGLGDFARASRLLDEALAMYSQMGGYLLWKMALITKGTTTWCLGDEAGAEKLYRLAQEHSRDKDFDYYLAGYYLGCLAYLHENYAQAEHDLMEYVDFIRQREGQAVWVDHYLAMGLFGLGEMALHQGDIELAWRYLAEGLAHHLKNPFPRIHAVIHFSLGKVARRQADLEAARRFYREALPHWGPLLGGPGLVYTLQALADLEAACGRHAAAARLLGSAGALRPRLKNPYVFNYIIRLSTEPVDTASTEACSRQALGEQVFAAAYAEGAALTKQQAYDLAWEICGGQAIG